MKDSAYQKKFTGILDLIQKNRMGRPGLGDEFCNSKLDQLYYTIENMESAKTVGVVTGFWIKQADAPETDGPSSSIHICYNLLLQNKQCYLFTDSLLVPYFESLIASIQQTFPQLPNLQVLSLQLNNNNALEKFQNLDIIFIIEKVGFNFQQQHLSMRAINIDEFTDLQYSNYKLFNQKAKTLAVGDGGNEIGCGSFDFVNIKPKEIKCTVKTDNTILCDISNFGGQLISRLLASEIDYEFLKNQLNEEYLVKQSCKAGFVDGVLAKQQCSVDGMNFEEYLNVTQLIWE